MLGNSLEAMSLDTDADLFDEYLDSVAQIMDKTSAATLCIPPAVGLTDVISDDPDP